MRPSSDGVQAHSRFSRLGTKVEPINTILDDITGVVKLNFPFRSKGVLIGEILDSGEVNAGSIGQVFSVDAKRPIEIWTKGVGLV